MRKRSHGFYVEASQRPMSKRKKSPCVDVCRYPGPKGWCVACGMTMTESRAWYTMKPYDRNALLSQLKRRVSQLKARGQHNPSGSF